jgi:hypothetical protein
MRPDGCGGIVLRSMRREGEYLISAVPVGRSIRERHGLDNVSLFVPATGTE